MLSAPARPDGLVVSPFRALRYALPTDELRAVLSPPYDLLDDQGVTDCEQLSPSNVVRLILPREQPAGAGDRYACAAGTLAAWRAAGLLTCDDAPGLYVYEQDPQDGGPPVRGLLAAVGVTPPQDRIVLPHEDTAEGPVLDRLALSTAVDADLEPILLVHDGEDGPASQAVADAVRTPATVDVEVGAHRHRLWALTDPALLAAVVSDLHPRRALIADGHHRWEAYRRRQAAVRGSGGGAGPWDAGLALLVDARDAGLALQPVHRVLPGSSPADLAAEAAAHGASVQVLDGLTVEDALDQLQAAVGPAFLLSDGQAAQLRLVGELPADAVGRALPAERSAAWRSLEVTVLHHYLARAVWGRRDDGTDVLPAFGVETALHDARAGSGTAVLLRAPAVRTVLDVALAGERMPRKSTSFAPKPLSGLVLRPLTP